jgi:tRNA G10  N-methylase Trm11
MLHDSRQPTRESATQSTPYRRDPVLEHPERVVAIAVLECPGGRRRQNVYRTTSLSSEAIDTAIESLEQAGVVVTTARTVRASAALARLDTLGLIGI